MDGRIEPGDMILEVNGISFENLGNDEAVRILRDVVQKSGSANFCPTASHYWLAMCRLSKPLKVRGHQN